MKRENNKSTRYDKEIKKAEKKRLEWRTNLFAQRKNAEYVDQIRKEAYQRIIDKQIQQNVSEEFDR